MAKSHWAVVIALSALLLVAGEPPAAAVDEVLLFDGSRLRGDLDDAGLTLVTPSAVYQVSRERAWRVVLGHGATGDSVDLRNGNRLSGWIDRPAYTLRVTGGEARTLPRADVALITLGAAGGAGTPRLTDVVVLANGDHVFGEIVGSEFDLRLPTGTSRFGRDVVWQILLGSATGDTLRLGNGGQLSGVVEQPRYEIRTPDGQVLAFGRDEVRTIVLHPPARPRAAAPAPATAAAATPPAPAPAAPAPAVAPAALPPTVRAVLRDLQFEFDRWELIPEARGTLEELATAMKAYPDLRLTIEGHADERGTSEYNLALGARRAQSARDYLVSLGIAPERLETVSYGEERPADPGHNELAWTLNRRAHFVVKAQ
jgi:peptidoglycan-associated lipoprotein